MKLCSTASMICGENQQGSSYLRFCHRDCGYVSSGAQRNPPNPEKGRHKKGRAADDQARFEDLEILDKAPNLGKKMFQ